MGDIVSLVEKAESTFEHQKTRHIVQKTTFDLDDFAVQLRQISNMGGLSNIVSLVPGVHKTKHPIQKEIDDQKLRQQEAMILSMTKQERSNVKILNASRRRRIAQGSGTTVQQVNLLLKQYQEFSKLMKHFKTMSPTKLRRKGLSGWLR